MDSLGYLLAAAFLTLLNVHWWVWSAVVHFICRRTIKLKDKGGSDVLSVCISCFIASSGIIVFEDFVNPNRLTLLDAFLAMAIVMLTLLGIRKLDRKSVVTKAKSNEKKVTTSHVSSEKQSVVDASLPASTESEYIPKVLRDLKQLLDDGVISEEDFAKKKQELLNKM